MLASLQSSHHPTQMAAPLKPQIDWVALSPAFTSAEAASNSHQMDPLSMPEPLLMMMHLKLFIPLSMLIATAITRIRFNDDLKYKKIPFGFAAGKYALDNSHFLAEQSLSDANYMQVHKNWVALVKLTADKDIYEGWKVHHDVMTGYDDLVT